MLDGLPPPCTSLQAIRLDSSPTRALGATSSHSQPGLGLVSGRPPRAPRGPRPGSHLTPRSILPTVAVQHPTGLMRNESVEFVRFGRDLLPFVDALDRLGLIAGEFLEQLHLLRGPH